MVFFKVFILDSGNELDNKFQTPPSLIRNGPAALSVDCLVEAIEEPMEVPTEEPDAWELEKKTQNPFQEILMHKCPGQFLLEGMEDLGDMYITHVSLKCHSSK
jgi:hypothetical protein